MFLTEQKVIMSCFSRHVILPCEMTEVAFTTFPYVSTRLQA